MKFDFRIIAGWSSWHYNRLVNFMTQLALVLVCYVAFKPFSRYLYCSYDEWVEPEVKVDYFIVTITLLVNAHFYVLVCKLTDCSHHP